MKNSTKKSSRSASMKTILKSDLNVSKNPSSTQNILRENTERITDLKNMTKNEYDNEAKIYQEQAKVDFSNVTTRSISKNIYDDDYYGDFYFIDSGIPIYDQGSTSTCVANSCCFVYTYVMAVGINKNLNDMSWWDYAKSPYSPPLASELLKWIESLSNLLQENSNRSISISENWENCIRRFESMSPLGAGKVYDTTIFSRTFMMWSAYYLPDPPFPINRLTKSEGTQILTLLEGIKNFGCVINYNNALTTLAFMPFMTGGILNLIPFHFYPLESRKEEFSSELYGNITNLAFKGLTYHPNKPTSNATNEIINIVRNNISDVAETTWKILKNNNENDQNVKIISLENNEKTIIETLRAGYPFIFSMKIFNYKKDGPIPIPLENNNGLRSVLKYVDSSQIIDNAAPEYHAVVAVGYKKVNGIFYIIVRNSWGAKFGLNGCFYMPITFMTNYDSITNDFNCTSFYTITLNSDTFPKIKKLYFTNDKTYNNKVDTIAISKFNLNLIDYLYIQNVKIDELTFKFEKLSNSDFYDVSLTGSELIINRKSNTSGQCKIIVSSKYLNDESVILNWNIDLLYFTYGSINRVPVSNGGSLTIYTEVTDISTLLFSNNNDKITYSIQPLPMLAMNALVDTNSKLIVTSNRKGGCKITAFQENVSLTAICNLIWNYNVGPRTLYFTLNKSDLSNDIDYIIIKSEVTDLSNFLYSKYNDKINYSIKSLSSYELNASLSDSILRITNSSKGACKLTVVQENTLFTANVQLFWDADVGPRTLYFTLNKSDLSNVYNDIDYIIIKSEVTDLSNFLYSKYNDKINYSIKSLSSYELNASLSDSILRITNSSKGACELTVVQENTLFTANVQLSWDAGVGPTQLLYFTLNKNINPPIETDSIEIKRNTLGFMINSLNLSLYTYASFTSYINYSISNNISGDAFIDSSMLNFISQSGSCIIEAYSSVNFLKATVTLSWRM
jgi:C1A family cysteine protease